jgi:hypothetical protein
MRFRNLRIAWTVAWGIAAVLLCVLWVRSYGVVETHFGPQIAGGTLTFTSMPSVISVGINNQNLGNPTTVYMDVEEWWMLSCPDGKPLYNWWLGWFRAAYLNVAFPYWFATLTVAGLAAASWLPLKRFSLRALLIATTLVTVVLGLIVWLR